MFSSEVYTVIVQCRLTASLDCDANHLTTQNILFFYRRSRPYYHNSTNPTVVSNCKGLRQIGKKWNNMSKVRAKLDVKSDHTQSLSETTRTPIYYLSYNSPLLLAYLVDLSQYPSSSPYLRYSHYLNSK